MSDGRAGILAYDEVACIARLGHTYDVDRLAASHEALRAENARLLDLLDAVSNEAAMTAPDPVDEVTVERLRARALEAVAQACETASWPSDPGKFLAAGTVLTEACARCSHARAYHFGRCRHGEVSSRRGRVPSGLCECEAFARPPAEPIA